MKPLAMDTYDGVEGLYVDEWSATRPGRFTPEERTPKPTGQKAFWAPEPVCMF